MLIGQWHGTFVYIQGLNSVLMDIARTGDDALCPSANVTAKKRGPSKVKLATIRRVFISKF
jgi:hypothetical protein